jgi:hypothetical protein
MAILKGPVNPVVTGITTFPELDNIQVTTPNRHSVDPTLILDFANSRTLDPRITFTRGSAASYYDGSTALAEQNLAAYSQEFENAYWTKNGTTISSNAAAAPDGTTTADLIYPASTGVWRIIYKYLSDANKTYTASFYAKPSGMSWFMVQCDNTSNTSAWFNVTTGSVGAKGSATIINHSMTSVGNGWYRCQITFNSSSAGYLMCGVSDSDGSSTATASGTNGILIWGGQLEERNAVTAYTATTTLPITNYVPVLKAAGPNQPRFDVDPITRESKGLLIEEQRTNLATYSSDYNSGNWVRAAQPVTSNAAIAPDGTLTAAKLVPTAVSAVHDLYIQFTASAATYTGSFYAKAGEYNLIMIRFYGSAVGCVVYNLTTFAIDNSDGSRVSTSITPVGNGWCRITLTTTLGAGTSYFDAQVISTPSYTFSASSNVFSTGNGFSGVYTWGWQLEVGSFATSYIPTVAATVTRATDLAIFGGSNFSSIYNNTAGSLYTEFSCSGNFACPVGIFNTNTSITEGNRIEALFNEGTNGLIIGNGTSGIAAGAVTATANTYTKAAFNYGTGSANTLYKNGVSAGATGSIPVGGNVNAIYLGTRAYGNGTLNGTLKKVSYYPVKLTLAELSSLTIA